MLTADQRSLGTAQCRHVVVLRLHNASWIGAGSGGIGQRALMRPCRARLPGQFDRVVAVEADGAQSRRGLFGNNPINPAQRLPPGQANASRRQALNGDVGWCR